MFAWEPLIFLWILLASFLAGLGWGIGWSVGVRIANNLFK